MAQFLKITLDVYLILLSVAIAMYIPRLFFLIYGFFKQKALPEAKKLNRYAVILPARNESKVIRELLTSVRSQDYPQELLDIFVIVTDSKDPTLEICKEYDRVRTFVLPEGQKGKGKSLDFAMKQIVTETPYKYSAFFVFDADNVLKPDFISRMNDVYMAGYEVAMGRRLNKTWGKGWVSNCSALTFSFVNTLNNKLRSACGSFITISGSAFFVSNRLVREWGGWPFYSLTEDYELTKYSILNDNNSYYCEYAQVYDEQVTSVKTSVRQRLRWLKGHADVDRAYNFKLLKQLKHKTPHRFIKVDYLFNLIPVLVAILASTAFCLISAFTCISWAIQGSALWSKPLIYLCVTIAGTYGVLVLYTFLGMMADRKIIKFTFLNFMGMLLLNPLFMALWLPTYIISFFRKRVEWTPIDHSISMSSVDKQKELKG